MRTNYLVRLLLLMALGLILAACRKEEPLPTAVPIAVVPTQTTAPATLVEPTVTATAVPPAQSAVDPADIDWNPQIIYSSPAPGEEATLDGAITLRFDQPMDQRSVEGALEVTAVEDGRKITGKFTWTRPDTVVFTPEGNLQRQALYRVNLGQQATGENGLPLAQPLEAYFETVGYLQVSQTLPDTGSRQIETDAAITVLFNRPVVPLVATNQQQNLPQPLSFSPAVTGQGEWVSTSIYRFVPDEPLAGDQTYDVAVAGDLTDIAGAVLGSDYTFSFHTLSPSVVTVYPPLGEPQVKPSATITVTFNMPMNRATTETAVAVGSIGGEVPAFDYRWSEDDRSLTLIPQSPLSLGSEYQVQVGRGATSATGGAALDGETTSNFFTVPYPAVSSTYPNNGALADRWQRGFSIDFVSPMDFDTLNGRLTIDPPPAKEPDYRLFETSLYVDFEFQRDTEYTITIPEDVADPYGNTIGRTYTWRFTSAPPDPLASLNLPGTISQFSTSFDTYVGIIYRNVPQLDATLYDLGLPLNLINEPYSMGDYRPDTEPLRSWSIPIETEPGVADVYELPLADGGVLPTGVYMLSVTTPNMIDDARYWQNQRSLLIMADTSVVVKEMLGALHVWTTEIESGQPVSGRNLTLYNEFGGGMATAVTDANGWATFTIPQQDYLRGYTVVSNRPGEAGFGLGRSHWSQGADPWQFGIFANSGAEDPLFAYIYTDRPIYRPGDTIYFKGIVRTPQYGRYTLPNRQTVNLHINSAFYYDSETLNETIPVTLDEYGHFTVEYQIAEDFKLSTYQFYIEGQAYDGYRNFTVADYRKPEFLITMTASEPEKVRGETAQMTLEAAYFFGGAATDLQVDWTVYEESFYPDIDGTFYYFGDGGNFFYQSYGPFGNFGGGGGSPLGNYVTGGNGRTDGNGQLIINLPADLLAEVEEGSRRVTVEANVSDLSEFPITSRGEIIYHSADLYVGVRPANYLSRAGDDVAVEVITVDWDGRAVANQTVDLTFYQRRWEASRETQYGMYYTDWTPIDTEVARDQVTTDGQGKANASFVPDEGGSYLVIAQVRDGNGRTHTSSANLWVMDNQFISWQTDPRDKQMDLVADQESYRVGDTAQIMVQSPFAGPVQAWLTIERGDLLEQQLITLQSNSDVIAVPIRLDHAPNVFVSITAVKPVNRGSDEPYADVRLGIVELEVSPEPLTLNIEMTPQQSLFVPGETAVYDIRVTNASGQPVQAELSLALVDLAVLTLKEDNVPPIADVFYQRQPYRSQLGGGLFITAEGLEPEIPQDMPGMGGGGGDGLANEAVAKLSEEDEDEARQDFPDTAYWEAKVQTDGNGRVTVEIPLPDSTTTWRLSSKAINIPPTNAPLVGQNSVDVVATLPLLLRPVTPRFFTVGDIVQLGTMVHNNTDSSIEAAVSLTADGLTLHDAAEQTITIPANGRQLVRWQAVVDDVALADLTFRANGGGYSDATKPTFGIAPDQLIPVYRYTGQDIVATSGILADETRRVEAILLPPGVDTRQGTVDVTLNGSLAAAVITALDALDDWPYSPACASAVTDRLLPNAVTARAVRQLGLDNATLEAELDRLIPAQVAQLQALVKEDGGWSWCYNRQSDTWLTAYSLLALLKAEEAGYDVDTAVLSRAARYLVGELRNPADLTEAYAINRQAFLLYVLAQEGSNVSNDLDGLFNEHRALLNPYAKAFMIVAYEALSSGADNQQALLSDLNNSAVVSATGAHWEDPATDYFNLSSDVRGTAVVIHALAQVDPDSPFVSQAVRWLMVARTAQSWSTAHETAWSLLALTDWMAVTGELTADYEWQLNVNLDVADNGRFQADNITTSEQLAIPIGDLVLGEPNYFDFQRTGGDGRLYYTLHLNSAIAVDQISPVSRGMTVQRVYYDAECDPSAAVCQPITEIAAGQQVRVELTIIAHNDLVYAVVEDPLPAGAEGIDPNLATTSNALSDGIVRADGGYGRGYWGWWYFNNIEYRDEKVVFWSEFLPAGTYQYTYHLQTNIPGNYQVMPAIGKQEYFPEVFGRSAGMLFTITATD